MVNPAAVQVLAATTLPEVVATLNPATAATSAAIPPAATATPRPHASRRHNPPSVASVTAVVPEHDASMTPVLEELDSHGVPPTTVMPSGHPAAPAVQAIIVERVAVVDPELASIIGDELKMVPSSTPNDHPACPTRSKVISTAPAAPPAACVAVVHPRAVASMVNPAAVQVLAPPPLPEVIATLNPATAATSAAIPPATTATP